MRWNSSPTVSVAKNGPEAIEVLRLLQSRIYFNVTRAVVGRALIAAGGATRLADAPLCAARAFDAVARARMALVQMSDLDEERNGLIALLDAIARELEERFPDRTTLAAPRADEIRSAGRLVSGRVTTAPGRGRISGERRLADRRGRHFDDSG